MNTINQIKQHYFTDHLTVDESPLVILSVVSIVLGIILAFLVSGLDGPYTAYAVGAGFIGFGAFTVAHFGLWILGAFYRKGVLTSIRDGIVIFGMIIAFLAVAALLLYGWFIPLTIASALLTPYIPQPLTPLVMIGGIAISLVWYSKGLKILDM